MTVAWRGDLRDPARRPWLTVTGRLGDLIALGREIKWALNDAEQAYTRPTHA